MITVERRARFTILYVNGLAQELVWVIGWPAPRGSSCSQKRYRGGTCGRGNSSPSSAGGSVRTPKPCLRPLASCAGTEQPETRPEKSYPQPVLRQSRTIREPPASADLSAVQRARLREEAEAPFRKARQFLYAGGVASAAVASLIALSSLLALTGQGAGTESWWQAVRNLGIDVAGGSVCAALYRWDEVAAARRLERMQQGARLAALMLESQPGPGQRFPLASLRGQYRVVITVSDAAAAHAWLTQAAGVSDRLIERRVAWVPVVRDPQRPLSPTRAKERPEPESSTLLGVKSKWLSALDAARLQATAFWIATPVQQQEWLAWIHQECTRAKNVQPDEDLTFIIRKDGRVGARIRGLVGLSRLLADLDRLGVPPPR
jgi:hypothetical protein